MKAASRVMDRMRGVEPRAFSFAALLLMFALNACKREITPDPTPPQKWELFAAAHREVWQEAQMQHSGGVDREDAGWLFRAGAPMTGIVFPEWEKAGLPVTDYRITYEATRISGSDFFGSVTFPVGSRERCVTFVLGGWGGSQVGISSIDGLDASSNATGSSQPFETGKWYRIRIEVRKHELAVWMNDRPLVRADISRAQLGLRGGEIDRCVPFGFATYETEGRVRACVIEVLHPAP